MKKFNMITPEGTKDTLFEECLMRQEIAQKLRSVFRMRGYNEVMTPGIEYYDVFDLPGAAIPQQEMYKSTDNKGRLVVFRPDLTLPIARLAATRLQNLTAPIRLCYTQSVYRNRPDLSGRSDESTQAGIELLGAGGIRADLEVVLTAIQALQACAISFRLEIGYAGLFDILAGELAVSGEEKEALRVAIEAKNYAALSAILATWPASPQKTAIQNLPRLFGGAETLERAAQCFKETAARVPLGRLKDLYKDLQKLGLGDSVILDLGLVQRNDYYTGMVFCAYVEGHGAAVLRGGRYDTLLEKFSGPMAAAGFGVDVDAVAEILLRQSPTKIPLADLLVYGYPGFEIEAQLELQRRTAQGLICESALFETIEENTAYARRRKIPKLVAVGQKIEERSL